MTGDEIRAAAGPLLDSTFALAVGSRPRRYQPNPEVLDGLRQLAQEPLVRESPDSEGWGVVEGRRWLLDRRLDGRSVPLVQREHVAIVVRSWAEARDLAALLNWCGAVPPARGDDAAYLAARRR
ncbi:MAG TPA: hypothetical protein VMN37_02450 [Gemmatimonadales bacterium]|nr:hypothetical protein [Gemmatimonadales bacterium]